MADDSSVNFLNCRKQYTNPKLRTFYLRLKESMAAQVNHRYTISAKLPTKLISGTLELLDPGIIGILE